MAESALVPEQLAALMLHVAQNLDAHAEWVRGPSEAAQLEHAALLEVAAAYRAIAQAAEHAMNQMRSAAGLAPAPHDPSRWDQAAFVLWMRRKVELQRAFAQLLLEHADASERALQHA